MEIIPAILPTDFDDIREHLALVRGTAPLVQIDITDGHYTPDATWPYVNDDTGVFKRMANEEEVMPYWQEVNFEIDMMTNKAETVVSDWLRAGASRFVFHVDSESDIPAAIHELRQYATDPSSSLYTPIGVAMNTTTSIENVVQYLEANGDDAHTADFVQCMGIERIGYQGEGFDERVLDNIEELRGRYQTMPIAVDGSVNQDTVPQLVESGATRLVAGSAVFESGDVADAIQELRELAGVDESAEEA